MSYLVSFAVFCCLGNIFVRCLLQSKIIMIRLCKHAQPLVSLFGKSRPRNKFISLFRWEVSVLFYAPFSSGLFSSPLAYRLFYFLPFLSVLLSSLLYYLLPIKTFCFVVEMNSFIFWQLKIVVPCCIAFSFSHKQLVLPHLSIAIQHVWVSLLCTKMMDMSMAIFK